MKIMVVGGGGREHAIIHKLRENAEITEVYALPGNAGIGQEAQCVSIKATDIDAIVDFAVNHGIEFAVVAPDDPLAMGAVDALHAKGIPCFGPEAKAAQIESSKAFAKKLMRKYHIPTASFEVFTNIDAAMEYVRGVQCPVVVKADGLALGKGVLICQTNAEAEEAVRSMMLDHVFGKSGSTVVVEEYLEGPEVSVLAFTDGNTVKPMISSMDHKRALDNDEGLNTGGMGTVAPNPYYTPAIAERCMREIFLPTIEAMKAEGRTFKGCLYFGLMLTKNGPKVIEYNCRFGDPETQVVLPLLKSDLFDIMRAVEAGTLASTPVEFSDGTACCVMLASGGYPEKYEKGKRIDLGRSSEKAFVYHSGTALDDEGQMVTAGGRVLGVACVRETLREAVDAAYDAASEVTFEKLHMRRDIGKRALACVNTTEE